MWKTFKILESVYMLNLDMHNNDLLKLKLTNLTHIWEDLFSGDTLEINFTECNPLVETTKDSVKEMLIEFINELPNVNTSLNNIDNDDVFVELILDKKLEESSSQTNVRSVIYKFVLQKQNEEKFKSEITTPLIRTIHLLENQQNVLVNLLKRKDRELEEYRLEKGEIGRTDLKTEHFTNEIIKQADDALFLNFFNKDTNYEFWKDFNLEDKNIALPAANRIPAVERKQVIYNASKKKKINSTFKICDNK